MPRPRNSFAVLDTALLLAVLAFGLALSPRSQAAGGPLEADGLQVFEADGLQVFEADGLQVFRGAVLATRGVFGGSVVPRNDPGVARALPALLAARALLPVVLRVPVVIQLDPVPVTFRARPTGIQAYPASGMIVAHGAAFTDAERTLWLHELLHLSAGGARPRGPVGARLMAAIDEGVADFGAAAFSGSTTLGSASSGEVRDLLTPPLIGESEWAYLALPSAPWRAHRMGWALATVLLREAAPAPFATDVVSSLASPAPFVTADTPRAVLGEWISRCPPRSRAALRRAVARWVPPELLETEPT